MKKYFKQFLLVLITIAILEQMMITNASTKMQQNQQIKKINKVLQETNIDSVRLYNAPQYINKKHLMPTKLFLTLDERAMMVYYELKNNGIIISKDDIYEKIMNVDKTTRKMPNNLDLIIQKNMKPLLEWRDKINKKEIATLIYQNPEMPNGCEITSATMLLNWMGYNVDKMTMHNDYLPKYPIQNGVMPNPNEYYMGDARKGYNGWYCFEQPIVTACNNYLKDVESDKQVKQVSGLSQEEMDKYLEWNIPLVIWMTTNYGEPRYSNYTYNFPNGESFKPYTGLHCVLVVSKNDDDSYNIADPIIGWKTISSETFWYVFTAMESRAVTIDCDNLIL